IDQPDVPSFLTWLFGCFLLIIFFALFCEVQPFVINALFKFSEGITSPDKSGGHPVGSFLFSKLQYFVIVLTPFAAYVGFLSSKLGFLIKRASESPDLRARAIGLISKFLIYLSALVVPFVLWVAYLDLCYWGIGHTNASGALVYEAPRWVLRLSQSLI